MGEKATAELKVTDLATLIGTAIAEANKPLIESVRTLQQGMTAARESLIPAPNTTRRSPFARTPEEIAARRKEWDERFIKDGFRRSVPEDQFSFVRFFLARKNNDWSQAPFEQYAMERTSELYDGNVAKALGWASGSSGGYWVDQQFMPQDFIDIFTAEVICRAAGCVVMPCTGSPVLIPRATASHTASWVTQNTEIPATSPTPGNISLNPHWCVGRSIISRFLQQVSAGTAEGFIRMDLARQLALAVDLAMLEGTGSSGQPTGMSNTGSINTVPIGTNGGAITPPLLRSMEYQLNLDNVPRNNRAWLMHPRTWSAILQLVTENSTYKYLVNPNFADGTPPRLLGYPVFESTQVAIDNTKGESGTALANIFLVRMADIILGEWGAIELEGTDIGGTAWANNSVEFKATYTVDVGVRNVNSICLISDSSS